MPNDLRNYLNQIHHTLQLQGVLLIQLANAIQTLTTDVTSQKKLAEATSQLGVHTANLQKAMEQVQSPKVT